jgi:hypothetical protein
LSLFAAIKSHLLHDSKVALLVDDRVYHMAVLGERTPKRPYIVFQIIGRDGWRHMENTCGVVDGSVQITCYGDRDTDVDDVSEAVRRSLDHLNHRTIGRAPDTITVRAAFLEDEFPGYTSDDDGREWGAFSVIQEWRIVHAQSLPALAV